MEEPSRYQKVKQHLKDHKETYLAAVGGVVIGGTVVGIVILRYGGFQMPEIQQTAQNQALINWKPSSSNIALTMAAEYRGHPGNETMCLETLETFSSQRRAARAENATDLLMHQHLTGKVPDINGRHFVKTGEHSIRR